MLKKSPKSFKIRNVTVADIKQVYNLLLSNRPYVGLNSRYTYFLLAKDFSDTCVVVEKDDKIVAFSSAYIPPRRPDTLFSWETVVDKDYRGNQLQKFMLLHQIKSANVKYLEGTVNPSNKISQKNFKDIAQLLNTECIKEIIFSEKDFENDGHEAEILYRIGPIPKID